MICIVLDISIEIPFCAMFRTGAIVADIGSFATRIGYAGDDLPRAYFPTVSQFSSYEMSTITMISHHPKPKSTFR